MLVRRRWRLTGVVQGVGFRPHVARVAAAVGVTGLVGNDDAAVFIEAQGTPAQTNRFIEAVRADLPPLAHVAAVTEAPQAVVAGEAGFRIVPSRQASGARTLIPPDTAPCADCLREMRDPADRRHRYPFITCTNCGPRLSIIRDLPYDRPATTMAAFPMCPVCAAEYADPRDRRYHAQPISCFDCGPRLWFADADGREVADWEDGIVQARQVLAAGGTVAVKGIGGFTLFCDARQGDAVARLRQRKRRPGKPFAVMAANAASAARFADFSETQLRELDSPRRPIVLAPMGAGYDLAERVAPGLGDVGVMLPSAPLHHLLVAGEEVYVATSGNLAGEPLRYRNDEAVADLGAVVDGFLTHDRPIHVPVEDSVLMADAAATVPIRRSRGYAPLPVALGEADAAVLAVGGELKNTFAVTRDGMAFLSAHIGDMVSPQAQRAFVRSVEQMSAMHGRAPELVVADLHPDYATTRLAERYCEARGVQLVQVQHHLAHGLSLLAEHQIGPEVRAVVAAFDGAGYGLDGHIWGGEVLALGGVADPLAFERPWHLEEYWLPGGDAAQAAPWKCAVALLDQFGLDGSGLPPFGAAPPAELRLLRQLPEAAAAGLPGLVHRTTSAGRLFDAVASILGVRHRVTYEAQAAMELERLARACPHAECAAWAPEGVGPSRRVGAPGGVGVSVVAPVADAVPALGVGEVSSAFGAAGVVVAGRPLEAAWAARGAGSAAAGLAGLAGGGTVFGSAGASGAAAVDGPVKVLLEAVVAGVRAGRDRACLARRFHSGLAAVTAAALTGAADQADAEVVGLTGGVFQNRVLTRGVLEALAAAGRPALTHRLVPAGDGGLALGQARAGHTLLTWSGP